MDSRLKDVGFGGPYSSRVSNNGVERWRKTIVFAVAFSFLGIAGSLWVMVIPLPAPSLRNNLSNNRSP
jgi:hypothetical protein